MANFTKQAIKASFMKLLNQKPLSKISVRDIVEEGLAAAGLGRVAHVQDQLFFHVAAPPDFVAPIVAHGGGRCKFFGRGAKNVFTIRII